MPVQLADLQKDKRKVTIPIGIGVDPKTGVERTEDLTLTYKPSAYTSAKELELNAASEEVKTRYGVLYLKEVVIEWDLIGLNDKVFPLTEEALATLPTNFVGDVIVGITKDMGKDRATSSGS